MIMARANIIDAPIILLLLERCSLILADAESARVKSDEQDNHFPPLTALDREGAWLRKISKRHLVM